jgi:hypothetical protein
LTCVGVISIMLAVLYKGIMKVENTHNGTVAVTKDTMGILDEAAKRTGRTHAELVAEAVRKRYAGSRPRRYGDPVAKGSAYDKLRSFAGAGVPIMGPQTAEQIMERIRALRED